jgi:hypothetical protein
MTTIPAIWTSPLAAAFLAGFLAVASAVVTAVLTQRNANRREDVRWSREREREKTVLAHEDAVRSYERMQQRLADSYLEVLRIVEREGQWVQAGITNWEIAARELAEFGVDAVINGHTTGFERVKVPEPAITDRATAGAHLAAFGSATVRGFYEAWRSTITAIEAEEDALHSYVDNNWPPDAPGLDELRRLQNELGPKEVHVRRALANAIAEELGHRKPGAGDHPSNVDCVTSCH